MVLFVAVVAEAHEEDHAVFMKEEFPEDMPPHDVEPGYSEKPLALYVKKSEKPLALYVEKSEKPLALYVRESTG